MKMSKILVVGALSLIGAALVNCAKWRQNYYGRNDIQWEIVPTAAREANEQSANNNFISNVKWFIQFEQRWRKFYKV